MRRPRQGAADVFAGVILLASGFCVLPWVAVLARRGFGVAGAIEGLFLSLGAGAVVAVPALVVAGLAAFAMPAIGEVPELARELDARRGRSTAISWSCQIAAALAPVELGLMLAAADWGRHHESSSALVFAAGGLAVGAVAAVAVGFLARLVEQRLWLLIIPLIAPWIAWSTAPEALAGTEGIGWLTTAAALLPYAALIGRLGGRPVRRLALALALVSLVGLGGLALFYGRDAAVFGALETGHPPVRLVTGLGRQMSDFDDDGESSLFGGRDCAPFDEERGPSNAEVARNGLDDNCLLGDLADDAPRTPARIPVRRISWAAPPNIVLLTIDALRADRVGLDGSAAPTTPNIDRWFREAFRFRVAYSESDATRETLPSLLSGRSLFEALWHRTPAVVLDPRNRLLPHHLAEQGWHTLGVMPSQTGFGSQLGFAERALYQTNGGRAATAGLTTKLLLERLAEAPHRRFFAWAHYFDPHQPYIRRPRFADKLERKYDQEVAETDLAIGNLLEELDHRGVLARSIVVLTADHGEAMNEHGLKFHSNGVYEETVRVPLLIRVPGERGRVIEAPVSTTALAATLLELVGVDPPAARPPTLGSLWPLMAGVVHEAGPVVAVSVRAGNHVRDLMVREGRWKLISNATARPRALYDLERDPGEQQNLVGLRSDIVARLSGHAAEYLERVVGAAESRFRRELEHRNLVDGARALAGTVAPGIELAGVLPMLAVDDELGEGGTRRVAVRTFFRRRGATAATFEYRVRQLKPDGSLNQSVDGKILGGRYRPTDWPDGSLIEDVRVLRIHPAHADDTLELAIGERAIPIGSIRGLPMWTGGAAEIDRPRK